MQVCVFGKNKKGTLLFFEQGNDGANLQNFCLSRRKVLPNRRKMPSKLETEGTKEKRLFKPDICDSLLRR
jgi:hypothetical protein